MCNLSVMGPVSFRYSIVPFAVSVSSEKVKSSTETETEAASSCKTGWNLLQLSYSYFYYSWLLLCIHSLLHAEAAVAPQRATSTKHILPLFSLLPPNVRLKHWLLQMHRNLKIKRYMFTSELVTCSGCLHPKKAGTGSRPKVQVKRWQEMDRWLDVHIYGLHVNYILENLIQNSELSACVCRESV